MENKDKLSRLLELAPSIDEIREEISKEPTDTNLDTLSDLGVGAAQGATFNLSDEALAGIKSLGDVATSDKTLDDLSRLYEEYKKIEEERIKLAKERSPIASGAGNITGAIATGALTGGLGSSALAGANLAGRIGGLAALGATEGGLAAYGDDQDITIGAGLGALTGGVVGGLTGGVGKPFKALADVANDSESGLARAFGHGARTGRSLTEDIKTNIVPRKKQAIEEFTESVLSPAKKVGGDLNELYKKSDMLDLSNEISEIITKRTELTRGKENLLNDPANNQIENIFNKYFPGLDDINFQNVDDPDEISKFLSSSTISTEQAKNLINDLKDFGGDNKLYKSLATDFANSVKDKLPEEIKSLKKQFSKLAEIPEQITPMTQSGPKSLKDLGGIKEAKDVLTEKLRKDIYSLSEKSSKKSSDLLKEQYDSLIDFTKNSDLLTEQQKADVIKKFTDLKSTARDVKYLGHATQDPLLTDISAKTMALKESGLAGAKGLYRVSEGVGRLFDKGGKVIDASIKPITKLGEIGQATTKRISDLFKRAPSELVEVGNNVGGVLGESLSSAANAGDVAKANAILFSIIQNPIYREKLKESGYEE